MAYQVIGMCCVCRLCIYFYLSDWHALNTLNCNEMRFFLSFSLHKLIEHCSYINRSPSYRSVWWNGIFLWLTIVMSDVNTNPTTNNSKPAQCARRAMFDILVWVWIIHANYNFRNLTFHLPFVLKQFDISSNRFIYVYEAMSPKHRFENLNWAFII